MRSRRGLKSSFLPWEYKPLESWSSTSCIGSESGKGSVCSVPISSLYMLQTPLFDRHVGRGLEEKFGRLSAFLEKFRNHSTAES